MIDSGFSLICLDFLKTEIFIWNQKLTNVHEQHFFPNVEFIFSARNMIFIWSINLKVFPYLLKTVRLNEIKLNCYTAKVFLFCFPLIDNRQLKNPKIWIFKFSTNFYHCSFVWASVLAHKKTILKDTMLSKFIHYFFFFFHGQIP